jgi:hypothetical protein
MVVAEAGPGRLGCSSGLNLGRCGAWVCLFADLEVILGGLTAGLAGRLVLLLCHVLRFLGITFFANGVVCPRSLGINK